MRDDIERLREDLYMARRTVLQLVPDQFRSILGSYFDCLLHQQYVKWRRGTADRIAELAMARPSEENVCPQHQEELRRTTQSCVDPV
jgi:hypothetical protein